MADQIYSKILDTGVTHRLFPAIEKIYRPGLRSQKGFFSELIISNIRKLQTEPIILLLYGTFGFRTPFYNDIVKLFGQNRKFPIFYRSGGMFKTPFSDIFGLHRPSTYLCLITEHMRLKNLLRLASINVISEQSESAIKEVQKVYDGRVEKLTMGCDFDFWLPVPSPEVKKSLRHEFNIPKGKIVFFASGNFVPRKQLDKLFEVCRSIQNRNDFFLITAGQGDKANTSLLASLADPLVNQNQALLHPYVTGEQLRNLYWLSDLYVSVATNEGGPVSVMKAMACELPVLSTPVGETADTMKKYGVGKFVPIKKYDEWVRAVIDICEKGLPKPLDIRIAREAYHWPNVAQRFITVFNDLSRSSC
jgi:glycosyltransferase involved in cell wall biosynthesis